MTTNPGRRCPVCGVFLPNAGPPDRCPRCLLAAGLSEAVLAAVGDTDVTPLLLRPAPPAAVKLFAFGDYELIEEIARGGMGVVFKARQTRLHRTVALKFIHPGRLTSAEAGRRFRLEAQAAARLEHPHIVPIYEVGECAGQPFFAMPLMTGGTLAQRIADFGSRTSDVASARLVATVARAVHYAHQRGIIHRDLKPGNILLDGHGEPHLTDFGLAKVLTEGRDLTQTLAVLGTPHYMAPELAGSPTREVTTAADLYSLGAILYELLTGRPPFMGDTPWEVLRRVVEEEPAAPNQARRLAHLHAAAGSQTRPPKSEIDADLETICLKCLEKEPERRYSSAAGLAADLEKWLRQEPIMARRATTRERLVKWTRRNPALATTVGIALAVGLVSFTGVLTQWQRARNGERDTRRQLYAANVMLAHQAWEEGNLGRARALLEATRPTSVEDDPRGFEWRHVWHLCHHPQCRRTITNAPGGVMAAGFWSEDQLWLAGTHELRLADLEGQAQQALLTEPAGIQWLSHSPVATNLWALVTPRHEIKLWDLSSRRCLASFTNHVGSIRALAFSPDGQWLASAGDETVWLQPLNAPERRPRLVARYPTDATGVAFSRDSQHLFTCGRHPAIHLWNLANPSLPGATLQRHTAHLYCVVVSPDGSRLASAGADGRIVVWDSLSRRPLHEFMGRHGRVSTLAFSPDGCWVVSGSRDQTLRVWDLAQNRPFLVLRGHEREVTSVAFAPDSRTLVSTDGAGVAKVWDLTTTASASDLGRHPSWVDSLAFSPDGRRLASAGYIDPVIKLWEVDPRRELATFRGHPEPIHRVRFSRDGQLVATGGHEGTVRLWRAGQTEPVAILTNDFPVFALDFSTNGRVLATGGGRIFGHANARPGLVLWELESLRPAQLPAGIPDAVEEVVFDPHGRYLAAGFADGTVGLWEAATGRFLRRWQPHQSVVLCVAFSPDGRWLASGSADTTIVLSDADHPERRFHRLRGHTDWVYSLAFAPDERTLASLALGGTLKLWSLATHEVVLTLTAPGGVLTSLAFSPQNNLLATGNADGAIQLWPAAGLGEADASSARASRAAP